MSMGFIEELVRRGRLTAEQADALPRVAAERGGTLDTVLLELGWVDENTLLAAMATTSGLSIASPGSIRAPADPGALRAFPEQWARKYAAAPLALDRERGELSVLVTVQAEASMLSRLGAMLELKLIPLLTTEVRVHERLALLYGTRAPERLASLIQPARRAASATSLPPMPPPGPPEPPQPDTGLREALARLREARGRDELIQQTLARARVMFEFAAFFKVTDAHATGYGALGAGGERITQVALPTDARSAFATAIRTHAHFLGPLPAEDVRALAPLGRPAPRAGLIIPIRVRDRTVALLYVEQGPHGVAPRAASDLMLFTNAVGLALESLVKRRKTSAIGPALASSRPALPVPEPVAPPPEESGWAREVSAVLDRDASWSVAAGAVSGREGAPVAPAAAVVPSAPAAPVVPQDDGDPAPTPAAPAAVTATADAHALLADDAMAPLDGSAIRRFDEALARATRALAARGGGTAAPEEDSSPHGGPQAWGREGTGPSGGGAIEGLLIEDAALAAAPGQAIAGTTATQAGAHAAGDGAPASEAFADTTPRDAIAEVTLRDAGGQGSFAALLASARAEVEVASREREAGGDEGATARAQHAISRAHDAPRSEDQARDATPTDDASAQAHDATSRAQDATPTDDASGQAQDATPTDDASAQAHDATSWTRDATPTGEASAQAQHATPTGDATSLAHDAARTDGATSLAHDAARTDGATARTQDDPTPQAAASPPAERPGEAAAPDGPGVTSRVDPEDARALELAIGEDQGPAATAGEPRSASVDGAHAPTPTARANDLERANLERALGLEPQAPAPEATPRAVAPPPADEARAPARVALPRKRSKLEAQIDAVLSELEGEHSEPEPSITTPDRPSALSARVPSEPPAPTRVLEEAVDVDVDLTPAPDLSARAAAPEPAELLRAVAPLEPDPAASVDVDVELTPPPPRLRPAPLTSDLNTPPGGVPSVSTGDVHRPWSAPPPPWAVPSSIPPAPTEPAPQAKSSAEDEDTDRIRKRGPSAIRRPAEDEAPAPPSDAAQPLALGEREAARLESLPIPPLASEPPHRLPGLELDEPTGKRKALPRPSTRRPWGPAPDDNRIAWESHVSNVWNEWSQAPGTAAVVERAARARGASSVTAPESETPTEVSLDALRASGASEPARTPSSDHATAPAPGYPPETPTELRRETWVRASSRAGRALDAAPAEPVVGEIRLARGEPLPPPHSHVVTVSGRVERQPEPSSSVPEERTAVVDREEPPTPDFASLIDQLDDTSGDVRARARDALVHHGEAALPHLMRRFPGRLTIDPFNVAAPLPAFPSCGALLAVIGALGPVAHAFMSERLDDPLPAVRLLAVHFYSHVRVPDVLPRLTRRLHDEELQVGRVTVAALAAYRDLPGYQRVLAHLHSRLDSPSPNARRHAARLLGALRDASAVPVLAAVFDRRDKAMFDVVEQALAEITRQRLGPSTKKWLAWWEAHRRLARVDWLLEALDLPDEALRRAAADELRSMSGVDPGFQETGPKRARDEAKRKWTEWWSTQPRA